MPRRGPLRILEFLNRREGKKGKKGRLMRRGQKKKIGRPQRGPSLGCRQGKKKKSCSPRKKKREIRAGNERDFLKRTFDPASQREKGVRQYKEKKKKKVTKKRQGKGGGDFVQPKEGGGSGNTCPDTRTINIPGKKKAGFSYQEV